MSTQEYLEMKSSFREDAVRYVREAEALVNDLVKTSDMNPGREKTRKEKKLKDKERELHNKHYFLNEKVNLLEDSRNLRSANPLKLAGYLALGIVCFILSLLWAIHITVFVVPENPKSEFLNQFLVNVEDSFGGNFPLAGVLCYAVLVYYFMCTVAYGNYRLGIRVLWWKIYPLEVNKTLMSALLVNAWVLMLTAIPLVHLSVDAFPAYSRYTDVDLIFATQVSYIREFVVIFEQGAFFWIMIMLSTLTFLWLLFHPRSQRFLANQAIEQKKMKIEAEVERSTAKKNMLSKMFSKS
jgi:LMBR1 domain-containing protein 1